MLPACGWSSSIGIYSKESWIIGFYFYYIFLYEFWGVVLFDNRYPIPLDYKKSEICYSLPVWVIFVSTYWNSFLWLFTDPLFDEDIFADPWLDDDLLAERCALILLPMYYLNDLALFEIADIDI